MHEQQKKIDLDEWHVMKPSPEAKAHLDRLAREARTPEEPDASFPIVGRRPKRRPTGWGYLTEAEYAARVLSGEVEPPYTVIDPKEGFNDWQPT